MKTKSSLPALFTAIALFAGAPLLVSFARADHHETKKDAPAAAAGQLIPVAAKDEKWAAQARKEYRLEVCPVSDEKLGSMGKAPEYIYRVAGQTDRFVMFCCSGCEANFLKDPAKHLAKIDAAAKAKK